MFRTTVSTITGVNIAQIFLSIACAYLYVPEQKTQYPRVCRKNIKERDIKHVIAANPRVYLSIAIVVLLLGCIALFSHNYNEFRDAQERELMGKVTLKANQVRGAILGMVADITVLSDLASLKSCLRFKCTSGAHLEALESELTTFATAHQQYTQVRVLSSDGFEFLRWSYDGEKKRVTRIHELQDKSNRYYVQDTLEMPVGGTYISKIDHNIENGSLQIPLVPTVRAVHKIDIGTSEYLIILNRDLSSSIDAKVGEAFTYADADADAERL